MTSFWKPTVQAVGIVAQPTEASLKYCCFVYVILLVVVPSVVIGFPDVFFIVR